MNILCLDIEGGHGGSSRSLYYSLFFMEKSELTIEVWCKKKNEKLVQAYKDIGIVCRYKPDLIKYSALPKISRNIVFLPIFYLNYLKNIFKLKKLFSTVSEKYDLIHFNHEAFYFLCRRLKRKYKIPQTMHIRTMLYNNCFSRKQVKIISTFSDKLVCITENEKENIIRLGGTEKSEVIYNIVSMPDTSDIKYVFPNEKRFKVASLSNYAFCKGVDRFFDLALELKRRGNDGFVFIIAGDMRIDKNKTLKDIALEKEVDSMFIFLGHIDNPLEILNSSDVLCNLTRENNPWGRDILEALSLGKPVFSIGTYDKFVRNDENGFLYEKYNPAEIVDDLISLQLDSERYKLFSENALRVVISLCSGCPQAEKLKKIWNTVITKENGIA